MNAPATPRRRAVRLLAAGRTGLACGVLATRRARTTPGSAPAWVMAALGARHLVLALLVFRRPCGVLACWSGLADLTHATTMAVTALHPRWRRLALADGVVEATFGALSIHVGRGARGARKRRVGSRYV